MFNLKTTTRVRLKPGAWNTLQVSHVMAGAKHLSSCIPLGIAGTLIGIPRWNQATKVAAYPVVSTLALLYHP